MSSRSHSTDSVSYVRLYLKFKNVFMSLIGGPPLGQSGAVAPPKFFIRIDAICSFFSRADIDTGYLLVLFLFFLKFKKVFTLQSSF
jgi:hypothetical protein